MKTNKHNTTPILDGILDFSEMLIDGTLRFIESLFPKKNHVLETDFEKQGNVIKAKNAGKGIIVNGRKATDRKTSHEGTLLCGGTGTGKGINVVIPNALHLDNCSVVIHDPSGTVFKETAGHFKEKGFNVLMVDWEKSDESSGYNPLAHIKSNNDISSISHILVQASMGKSTSDPFWKLASESQLNMLIGFCLELPKHLQHLPNVLHMLETMNHSKPVFDKFVARFCKSEKLFSQYKSYISQTDKLNSSITANTKAALRLLESDSLALTMSYNEMDFSKLRKEKTVVYLRNNITRQKLYGPASSIFFNQLFENIFSTIPDEKEDLPVFMLLDEFSSLYISDFGIYLSNVRKHLCSVLHTWQSLRSISDTYEKQANAILANSRTQIYLPAGMDYQSAKMLSDRMGEYEWTDSKERRSKRKLMHPQELIQSDPETGYLLVGHHRPVQLKMTPYFKQRKLQKWSKTPAPELKSNADSKGIPLFDFKQL